MKGGEKDRGEGGQKLKKMIISDSRKEANRKEIRGITSLEASIEFLTVYVYVLFCFIFESRWHLFIVDDRQGSPNDETDLANVYCNVTFVGKMADIFDETVCSKTCSVSMVV